MSLNRQPDNIQEASERIKNFDEVSLGYTYEQAVEEAKRCLNCKNRPCMNACPVSIAIPDFLQLVANGRIQEAYKVIKESSCLPAVCGRVCPQETQCEGSCVRGIKGEPIAIGKIERFVSDYCKNEKSIDKLSQNGHKVAIIGSGPAGLTAAGELAKKGYEVTIYEALHKVGGVLIYGIPEFRLPKDIVVDEVDKIKNMGVKIETNIVIGKTLTIDDLFDLGNEAIFVATGAGLPRFMNIKGETLNGVYSANEYLTRINLMGAYKAGSKTPINKVENVVVVGGGNVAMDAARSAKRLGTKNVYIVYRRSENELPARKEEVEHAKEEGIIFKLLSNPCEIIGDEKGNVKEIMCDEMELGEPDENGRRKPVLKQNSKFTIKAENVIIAIGTTPNPLITRTTQGIENDKKGCIKVYEGTSRTSREGIFAGGDIVTGAATVILAMKAGKMAALDIDNYIKNI